MKNAYPVVLIHDDPGYLVYVPDFDINTEGVNITEAIDMARDAISVCGVCLLDDGKELPRASEYSAVPHSEHDIVTLIDVDFGEYRNCGGFLTRVFRFIIQRRGGRSMQLQH